MNALTASVRAFEPTESEYAALAALQLAVYPDYPFSAGEIRHEDAAWDHGRFYLGRWILEAEGRLVGWIQANHSRGSFVPGTYWIDGGVHPDARRRGYGTALYAQALGAVTARGATRVRAAAKESMADGVAFLEHRGFIETKRDWESRLFLRGFDASRFAGARERVEAQGIRISTLKDEMARDPDAAHKAFLLQDEIHYDVPSTDPPTPSDEATFRARKLEGPSALLDAFFLAIGPDGQYVGLSQLEASPEDGTFLWQGLTGTRREARGRGIAIALKLEAVRYARERGVEHIKTWNDQRNRPMLAINEALGFVRQPAWIAYEKEV